MNGKHARTLIDPRTITLIDRLKYFEQARLDAGDECGAEVLRHATDRLRALEDELEDTRNQLRALNVALADTGIGEALRRSGNYG